MDVQTLINLITFPKATTILLMNHETEYYHGLADNLKSPALLSKEINNFIVAGQDLLYVFV